MALGAIMGGWFGLKKYKSFHFVCMNLYGEGMTTDEKDLEKAEKQFQENHSRNKNSEFFVSTALTQDGFGYSEVKEIKKMIGSNGVDMVMKIDLKDFHSIEIEGGKNPTDFQDRLIKAFYDGFKLGEVFKIDISDEENPFTNFKIVD